jgi:hypothetical protein
MHGQHDLVEVIEIRGFGALVFGAIEDGQEQGGKNGDDSNDDEEFDEAESLTARRMGPTTLFSRRH